MCWFRTSRTHVSRYTGLVPHNIGDNRSSRTNVEVTALKGPPGHRRHHPREPHVGEVVADSGVSKSWVYELLARHRDEGDAALEPRSRRPHTSTNGPPAATVELIPEVRKDLLDRSLKAVPDTIGWHLRSHHQVKRRCSLGSTFGPSYWTLGGSLRLEARANPSPHRSESAASGPKQ